VPIGFFYFQDSPACNTAQHPQHIQTMKANLKQFWTTWCRYNQPASTPSSSVNMKPGLILVHDDVFQMPDTQLRRLCKHALPNTLQESTLLQRQQKSDWRDDICPAFQPDVTLVKFKKNQ
jgi:hypothetical protein